MHAIQVPKGRRFAAHGSRVSHVTFSSDYAYVVSGTPYAKLSFLHVCTYRRDMFYAAAAQTRNMIAVDLNVGINNCCEGVYVLVVHP